MKRRIYFIAGVGISVYEWHGRRLFSFYQFGNAEEDVANFKIYLQSAEPLTSQLLVDFLDEEFQHEKIPHLIGREKDNYINRIKQRHCRDAKFSYAKIIGREPTGRRDDELLITSIANSEVLDTWLQILIEFSVPIVGIWSLPLLSESLLKKLNIKKPNLFLVSRQVENVMRESFFKNSRLYLSRHVKTEKETVDGSELASYVSPGLEQIHKFLSNQRVIAFGQSVDVYYLIPESLIKEAEQELINTDALHFHFFGLQGIFKKLNIDCSLPCQADVLFSFLCSQQSVTRSHYNAKALKRVFWQYGFNKLTFWLGSFGSLVVFSFALMVYIASLEKMQQVRSTETSTSRLTRQYQERYAIYEPDIKNAELIRESVEFYNTLAVEAGVSPERFLRPLSEVLGRHSFSNIILESLSWEKHYGTELDRIRRELWKNTTPNLNEYSEYPYDETELDDIVPVVVLIGYLQNERLSYRDTVILMEDFVRALSELKVVAHIMVVRTPVDIRVTSRFSDQNGINRELKTVKNDAEKFEVMLLLLPTQNQAEQVKSDDV